MKTLAAVLFLLFASGSMLARAQTSTRLPATGAFIDNNGAQLYYQECGTGSQAVVLFHDGVVNSSVWDDVWTAFCKRFHTIRYDRRGLRSVSRDQKPRLRG